MGGEGLGEDEELSYRHVSLRCLLDLGDINLVSDIWVWSLGGGLD